jgi:hypothetical protein
MYVVIVVVIVVVVVIIPPQIEASAFSIYESY